MKKSGLSFSLALLVAGGATSVFAGSVKAPFNALNTQVNTTIAGEHGSADVTQLRDGGWLVTWHKGSEHWDVYQQRYAASGAKVDAEARVNTTENCNQDAPVATALADGGWLVTWQSDRQDRSEHWDIYQQRYAASGVKVGIETQINTTENGDQTNPATIALADGGWLVTWESNLQDDSGVDIYQQRYAASGAKEGKETRIITTESSDKYIPAVTALSDGGWLVIWQGWGEGGALFDVYQQRYAASGAKEGIETRVNTTTSRNQYKAAVATLADSGWLVTWESNRQDDSGVDIYQQRYAASGGKEGIETRVNTTENCYQTTPAATALADGGWLVTWHCGWSVYQQRYAVSGGNVGDETQVNSTTYSEDNTAVTSLADGGWVVTWCSGANIYQQRYDAVGNPVGG
ncbi:hypothetical protein J2X66_004397 [Pseudomonas sp. 3296]|uniref:hypothetical protein n=1 Tax=Pseudomonas sp. 3296 TaxID=2817753 RepID=UPI00285D2629|nr:hypothetical protein [Pseudomonas sp. 3296]MDR6917518.1 hypothetical protein [Pseudomonas sp. 3296]